MKKLKFVVLTITAATLIGCSTSSGTGALVGTGAGAVLGAVVGDIAGNSFVGTVIGSAIGAGAGTLIGEKMDKIKAQAQERLTSAVVEDATDANGLKCVKVTFDSGILFHVGKADLQTVAESELSNLATILKENDDCEVAVCGYASSEGTEEFNSKLSQERANAVTNYLTNNCGVPYAQIAKSEGYGATHLVHNADGSENYKASRRVEIYLYASKEMIAKAEAGTLS